MKGNKLALLYVAYFSTMRELVGGDRSIRGHIMVWPIGPFVKCQNGGVGGIGCPTYYYTLYQLGICEHDMLGK